ncbi:hypothetical protein F5Y08DRAFT_346149 [Xylaria arbuscula]|nr:hypothetical protein F5Y08DRAFT_346149 [Xylaria arbuscula]
MALYQKSRGETSVIRISVLLSNEPLGLCVTLLPNGRFQHAVARSLLKRHANSYGVRPEARPATAQTSDDIVGLVFGMGRGIRTASALAWKHGQNLGGTRLERVTEETFWLCLGVDNDLYMMNQDVFGLLVAGTPNRVRFVNPIRLHQLGSSKRLDGSILRRCFADLLLAPTSTLPYEAIMDEPTPTTLRRDMCQTVHYLDRLYKVRDSPLPVLPSLEIMGDGKRKNGTVGLLEQTWNECANTINRKLHVLAIRHLHTAHYTAMQPWATETIDIIFGARTAGYAVLFLYVAG